MAKNTHSYDVGIVGAGPTGCVTALAFAQRGASVLLLEANPKACGRLAGEWLHPPAVQILESLGVELGPDVGYQSGRGFVVFPDDGSREVVLPYRQPAFGMSIEHSRLVAQLRARCEEQDGIEYVPYARATRIKNQNLSYERRAGQSRTVVAKQIVGASGRAGLIHQVLGVDKTSTSYSRMAGLLLEDAELPFDGYGHVFLGAPGPVLAYRIDHRHTRVCIDVPLSMQVHRDKAAVLWDAYSPVFPKGALPAFRRALQEGPITWAANQIRPRTAFGREGLVLVGDSVGHHHPLTAVGMTLGFQDGVTLARSRSFSAYRLERAIKSRVPEMLAVALYEVFADLSDETVSMRRAVYELWRNAPEERLKTMGFLAGLDSNPTRFASSFVRAVLLGSKALASDGLKTGRYDHVREVSGELADRIRWMVKGALHLGRPEPVKGISGATETPYSAALKAATAKAEVVEHPSAFELVQKRKRSQARPKDALELGVDALAALQAEDGSWEGEVLRAPLRSAQYVLMAKVVQGPISAERRRRLLKHFANTQNEDGAWGASADGPTDLSTTALIYTSARLLGVGRHDPLLSGAQDYLQKHGAQSVEGWARPWLAMHNLYGWDGVPAPEEAPGVVAMAQKVVHEARYQAPETALVREIREELFTETYALIRFSTPSQDRSWRDRLERGAQEAKSTWLQLRGDTSGWSQLVTTGLSRLRSEPAQPIEQIRAMLLKTQHLGESPQGALWSALALWSERGRTPELTLLLERFETWIWEDEGQGTRVAQARTTCWDTAIAVQALRAAAPGARAGGMLKKAQGYLRSQQLRSGDGDAHTLDAHGGFCRSGAWHRVPCAKTTAEVMLAMLSAPGQETFSVLQDAARFLLNEHGRFIAQGEVSTIATCVAALAAFHARYPEVQRQAMRRAIEAARESLRLSQNPDGSWGPQDGDEAIFETLSGLRGMLASGTPIQDPDVRKACLFLKFKQQADGSWRSAESGHVVLTAWAVSALLLSRDADWAAIDRAARFLGRTQQEDGDWGVQAKVGRDPVTENRLYRTNMAVWALGMYEQRRMERQTMEDQRSAAPVAG